VVTPAVYAMMRRERKEPPPSIDPDQNDGLVASH
jgi:hypothetical protein